MICNSFKIRTSIEPQVTNLHQKWGGSGAFTGEGYVGVPYLNNMQVGVTFNDIVVNTDLQLISGFVETKFDLINNILLDIDKKLTGDIRDGSEKAAFTVNYTLSPDIQLKPFAANNNDTITDGNGNYIFTKGENGKYQIVFTDNENKEHLVETENIPFMIKDASGTTYEVNEKGDILYTDNENSNEDDKPISFVDRGFSYCTVNGKTDTLMDGHSLTILKDNLIKLNIGYNDRILYNKARFSVDEKYRKKLVIPYYWNKNINIDSVKWNLLTQSAVSGREFKFVPTTVGKIKLEINADDALPVVLTDTIAGIRTDTVIAGNRLKENKITITLNVIDGGILYFKPKNDDYYKDYGFDDAMISELQRANDYGAKLQISGTDYYIPWLGILPNTEAEIKLVFCPPSFGQFLGHC